MESDCRSSPVFTSLAFLLCLFLLHLTPITTADAPAPATVASTNAIDFIRSSCNATLYPDLCYTSLSRYANAVQEDPAQLSRVAIGVSLSKVRRMVVYVSNLSREVEYGSDHRASAALHDCFSTFGDAVDQIRRSLKQMCHLGSGGTSNESLRFQLSNVQTWMSAALTNEDTCSDGFQDVSDGPVKSDVCGRVARVGKFTSNALALVNSYAASFS